MFSVRELNSNDEEAFKRGFKEWEGEDLSWYTFEFSFDESFSNHLERLAQNKRGQDLKKGYVPSTMLYGFSDGEIVGRVCIRHELNDYLLNIGGHIGYSVAPRFRRKGFATLMMKAGLEYSKNELGLKKVLVTCDDDNFGSIKVIEKFNGVLENKVSQGNSNVLKRRYWIDLT